MVLARDTATHFWRGLAGDKTTNQDGFIASGKGITVANDPSCVQVSTKALVMDENANAINESIQWITDFNDGTYFLLALGGDGGDNIYGLKAADSKWYLAHNSGNTGYGGGLAVFGANCYWASNTNLGKITGAGVYTDSFQVLSATVSDQRGHPMKVFAGKLCVASGRFIDTLDADGATWTAPDLTLPLGSTIRAMDIFNDQLAILVDAGGKGKLFFWDGDSATYNETIDLQTPIDDMIVFDNTIFIFSGFTGTLANKGEAGVIYTFNGASLDPTFVIPQRGIPINFSSPIIHNNEILFGVDFNNSSFENGIYAIGRFSSSYPYALYPKYFSSNNDNKDITTAMFSNTSNTTSTRNKLYTAVRDVTGGTYLMDSYSPGQQYASGAYVATTQHDGGKPDAVKWWARVKVNLKSALAATSSIAVSYKVDDASSWTSAGTITASNQNSPLDLPSVNGRRIEFKFAFTVESSDNPQILSYSVEYKVYPESYIG